MALGDIWNANEVRAAVKGCRYIFHACSTHVYNLPAEEMYAVNVAGTQNVCDAAELNECERLIFTSTVSSLLAAPPASLTSASSPRKRNSSNKKIAEELVLSHVARGLPAVVVNPAFFVGPLDLSPSPFRLWVPLALNTPVRFVPSGGFNVLSAMDVARAHVWALYEGEIGCRYPVVGENISILDYVYLVNCACGRDLKPKLIPQVILRGIAHGRVFDGYVAALVSQHNYVTLASYKQPPRQPLSEVVSETVRWFKSHSELASATSLLRYVWSHYV